MARSVCEALFPFFFFFRFFFHLCLALPAFLVRQFVSANPLLCLMHESITFCVFIFIIMNTFMVSKLTSRYIQWLGELNHKQDRQNDEQRDTHALCIYKIPYKRDIHATRRIIEPWKMNDQYFSSTRNIPCYSWTAAVLIVMAAKLTARSEFWVNFPLPCLAVIPSHHLAASHSLSDAGYIFAIKQ